MEMFYFSVTSVTSSHFNLQIPSHPLKIDPGPASVLQPWTSACHPPPAMPPPSPSPSPSPRLLPLPPPSPLPHPWSPLTAAAALSHISSHG